MAPTLFQSAPAIAGGRSCFCFDVGQRLIQFQSAPAIAGGRSLPLMDTALVMICFNPRPPLLAGDPPSRSKTLAGLDVSIRARHCWRAIPAVLAYLATPFLFQSAPAIAGGRSKITPAIEAELISFQSAPAIAGGRSLSKRSKNPVL